MTKTTFFQCISQMESPKIDILRTDHGQWEIVLKFHEAREHIIKILSIENDFDFIPFNKHIILNVTRSDGNQRRRELVEKYNKWLAEFNKFN